MHRSSLARAQTVLLSVDLSHHSIYVTPFSQAMAMPAMRAGQFVSLVQVHAKTCGNCFLACVEMDESRNFSCCEFDVNPFFKFADYPHGSVSLQQLCLAKWHKVSP